MHIARSVSWNDAKKTRTRALVAAVLLALLALPQVTPTDVAHATASLKSVIVRELPGAGDGPETAIERFGGTIGQTLDIINGYAAEVPATAIAELQATPGVHSVTPNSPIEFHGVGLANKLKKIKDGLAPTDAPTQAPPTAEPAPDAGLVDPTAGENPTEDDPVEDERELTGLAKQPGSMYWVAQEVTGASDLWAAGYTGDGIDVAVLDSGVREVKGLRGRGKLVNGADFSFEKDVKKLKYKDTFGHGTHMAAIIAGRDDRARSGSYVGDTKHYLGMAPDARIVNVKLANALGATDVSQVIAGIQWVVDNRNANGMNIRVLNLSFGTDGVQDYTLDPLTYATEVAWHSGIVVVVAAGNGGYGTSKLNNPAYDPFVIAVGGADGRDTYDVSDDVVPNWSSTGDGTRNPDLVAPGQSVLGLRAPRSLIDLRHGDTAKVGKRFFKGTGTSQSAAVVSGAAALLLDQRPELTPDQVKALLTGTARPLPVAHPIAQGNGMIDLKAAMVAPTPDAVQAWPRATGTGSIDAARGSEFVSAEDGEVIAGEVDAQGRSWSGRSWSGRSWSGRSWSGRSWSGRSWSGRSWSGRSWSGRSWSAGAWSSNTWQ